MRQKIFGFTKQPYKAAFDPTGLSKTFNNKISTTSVIQSPIPETMVRLQDSKGDDWKAVADDYARLTSETSNRPIGTMLERADVLLPFSNATGILDNGCGPGPVMSRLLKDYQIPESCSLTCSDFSEAMVNKVEEIKVKSVQENGKSNWKRVQTVVQNAMDLQSIQDSSMSHVTAGWVRCIVDVQRVCTC